jgi:hypothetical protein
MRSPCRHTLVWLAALIVGLATGPAAQGKRPLAVDNLYDVRRTDRLERYLAWYEKYLKPSETSEARR